MTELANKDHCAGRDDFAALKMNVDNAYSRQDALKRETRARQELAKQTNAAKLVQTFLAWAAEHKDAPQKVVGKKECHETGDPEAGYCETWIAAEQKSVEWLVRDPRRVEFSSGGFDPIYRPSCQDIGAEPIRKWRWKDIGLHYHCRFPAQHPELGGMHAWIKHARLKTYVSVFSEDYLIDPPYDFDETLRTQGTTLR